MTTLVPYEPVRFDRLRQSRLATFDRCALSSRFEHELEASGWSSLPASRGRLTHRVLARCLVAMAEAYKEGPAVHAQPGVAFTSNEEAVIDVDAALGIFYTELREHGIDRRCGRCGAPARLEPAGEYLIDDVVAYSPARIVCQRGHSHPSDASNLPVEEALDVKWIVTKFAADNSFTIADLVDVEQRIGATLEYPHELADPDPTVERTARYLSGQLDALFIVGEAADHAIVLDWKDTWSLPAPTEVGFDGYFQQQFYAWLVLRNYPTVQRVTLREMYVRRSEVREADVYRDDLPRVEAMLAALAERFDRAYLTGNFPPSPGQHCLGGETRILTDQGVRSLRDCEGEALRVLDRHGTWSDATVRSFGVQPLLRVTFADGSTVRATPDHRWWTITGSKKRGWRATDERVTTVELERAPLASHAVLPDVDPEGVRHGFVFGDGWRRSGRDTCEVRFMPQDEEIAAYFTTPIHRRRDGYLYGCGLPGHYKTMPQRISPSYARGFIAGLHAADGKVERGGGVLIHCEGADKAQHIAEIARLGGCVVSSIRVDSDQPTNYSATGTITRQMMTVRIKPATAPVLKRYHAARLCLTNQMRGMYRDVVAIEPDGLEEVFCAVVPDAESFTLANGIITSNCGWCPKPDRCPIFPEARRGGGKIETQEQAHRWAIERVVAQRVVEDRDRELQPWAGRMGPIPISDHKGPRVLGFRDHERTSRPKREDLKIALRLLGVQISERDLDRLYRTTRITKFEQHPPGPRTHRAEAERDERLMEALRASVANQG